MFRLQSLKELNDVAKQVKKKAKVHIKADTGMGRLGFVKLRFST